MIPCLFAHEKLRRLIYEPFLYNNNRGLAKKNNWLDSAIRINDKNGMMAESSHV